MARNEGKDVQQVYDCLALDISDMDVRGRTFVRRVIEGYENLDLSSCVFYGCFPTQIENGICIKPETHPENLLLSGQSFRGLDLKYLVLETNYEIRDVDFERSNLDYASLKNLEVHDSDFSSIRTMHASIWDCQFTKCDFDNANFDGCELQTVSITNSSCHQTEFQYASLEGVDFKNCNLEYSSFSESVWSCSFEDCNLENAYFYDCTGFPHMSNCEVRGVSFERMDLMGEPDSYHGVPENLEDVYFGGDFKYVDFSNTNLKGTHFERNTYLEHVSFEGADLEGARFDGVTFEGHVSFKNANLKDVTFRNCEKLYNVDFEGADLSNVDYDEKDTRYFVDSDFSGKSLVGEDFSDEDIMGNIFTDADLEDADFRNSYLVGVDFENANLKNANFQGATLTRCNLKNANLENANLEFTNLEWADMRGSDVSFADFTLAKYNSGTILPDSITQSQIDSMTLTDAHEPRENSRGISVDFERVSSLVDDIRDYIWNNWNDLDHSQRSIILEGYETQFVNAQNELVTIPIVIEMTEDETHTAASYYPETGIVYVYLETESLPRFVQILNPNQNHPRWESLRNYLIAALVHEITHALDAKEEIRRERNKYTPSDVSLSRYYNTPLEVNAFANQIIAEILMSGETYRTVEDALKSSETWQEEKNTWSTKSKRTIMKRVYSRLFEDAQEPRENSSLSDSVVNDIVTVFESYENMVDNGFGGKCVAAAETVFENVLEHGNLQHPERLEIVAVWNTFCLEKGKPIGHVCLRYFVGEDREDHEAYVYIDSDLQEKEYHEVEAWGHMPEYMLETAFDLEKDASILEGYGDDEEFETTTLSFSNIEDFKNSPSYRMYCNVPL